MVLKGIIKFLVPGKHVVEIYPWFLHTCWPRVFFVIWMWSKDQGFVVEENCLRGLVGLKQTVTFFTEFGRLLDGLEADAGPDLEIVDDWPLKTRKCSEKELGAINDSLQIFA